jgi:hypothetical protein
VDILTCKDCVLFNWFVAGRFTGLPVGISSELIKQKNDKPTRGCEEAIREEA